MSRFRRKNQSLVGLADLVVAFANEDLAVADLIAQELGLEYRPRQKDTEPKRNVADPSPKSVAGIGSEIHDSTGYPHQIPPLTLVLPVSYRQRPERRQNSASETQSAEIRWREVPKAAPEVIPLTPWSLLGERLRSAFAETGTGRKPDIPRLVNGVARREVITRIPHRQERRSADLHVVLDESTRLIPFRNDQVVLMNHLRSEFPASCLTAAKVRSFDAIDEIDIPRPPEASQVLVVGDLGVFGTERLQRRWQEWAVTAIADECQLIALVPCAASRIPQCFHRLLQVISWQPDPVALSIGPARRDLVRHLFVLTSVCRRVEPGLLRALRCLIPSAKDVSLESDYWASRVLTSRHLSAATIHPQIARELRPEFERLPDAVRQAALMRIREWRQQCRPELWLQEVMCLSQASRDLLPKTDVDDAKECVRAIEHLRQNADDDEKERFRALQHRSITHYTDSTFSDPEVGHLIRQARLELRKDMKGIPAGTDPIEVAPSKNVRGYSIELGDRGVTLHSVNDSRLSVASATTIRSSNGIIEVTTPDRPSESAFWKTGKPGFVSDYGTDQYGAWFEFQVPRTDGVVVQRMRWIRPGTFLMGSPESERGRAVDEAQRWTEVKGFWLGDTSVDQDLWVAVVGDCASQFRGRDLPVERVNFFEVSDFLDALNRLKANFGARLPREFEWEYACRAGSATPFVFGEFITHEEANFDCRFPYGSIVKGEFRGRTMEVKSYAPNPFGLYQMHGNIAEWTSSTPRQQIEASTVRDTSKFKVHRMVRGGSWNDHGQYLRAACRFSYSPLTQSSILGFRILCDSIAEPTEEAEVPVAEQGSERTRFGNAAEIFRGKTVKVEEDTEQQIEISGGGPIRIRSNLEEIHLQQTPKPDWAVGYGKDMFGVYADFEVPYEDDPHPVKQRLRWIQPGRFQMGSPISEPGRYKSEALHSVTISNGYWIFDTPCTQLLWTAIMHDENPSRFVHPDRPVEQIAWNEATNFAGKLSSCIGLNLCLPTEAQWEYACRAGTSTAIYTGSLELRSGSVAPDLDQIAWYDGSSGHEMDLHDGTGTIWLTDEEIDMERSSTRPVRLKRPNSWGLYDMLGNIWEWCFDRHAGYSVENAVDPLGPESGPFRVFRGGSRQDDARNVRSACRRWGTKNYRSSYLGFRLVGPPTL